MFESLYGRVEFLAIFCYEIFYKTDEIAAVENITAITKTNQSLN